MKELKPLKERLNVLLECDSLTKWEENFLRDIQYKHVVEKEVSLSYKQESKLREIETDYGYSPFVGEDYFDPRNT